MSGKSITDVFKEATGISIGSGVIMILLELLAMFLPQQTGFGVSVVIGWIIVVAGLAYLAYAFAARGAIISLAHAVRDCLRCGRRVPGVVCATGIAISHRSGGDPLFHSRGTGDRDVFPAAYPAGFRMAAL